MNFKEELLNNIIPSVTRMIIKEENHMKYLMKTKEIMIKRSQGFFGFFYFTFKTDMEIIDLYIERSILTLNHLKEKADDYIKFAENL